MQNLKGLTSKEAETSAKKYGKNRIPMPKKKGFAALFFKGLLDPIILVLLASVALNALFSFGSLNWFETGGILAAVVLSTLVSALSEHSGSRAFEKLKAESENGSARLLRDGEVRYYPVTEIVTGDLVFLSAGEKIPADGVLLEGALRADQSALTGEGAEAEKRPGRWKEDPDPSDGSALFQGSLVSAGEGAMRVVRVGEKTLYGKIAASLAEEEAASPLKERLTRLAGQLCRIGYLSALVICMVSLFSSFVAAGGYSWEGTKAIFSQPKTVIASLLHAVSLAITVVVVAVPEGLPMMISVVLSANRKKMLREGVLVRKPVGIETCGSLNILFTDKTGTLTCGKHRVTGILTGDGTLFEPAEAFRREKLFSLFAGAAACGEAIWQDHKARGGNFTDRALLEFAGEANGAWRVLRRVPFDSAAKKSLAFAEKDGREYVFFKGAPELFLPRVRRFFTPSGESVPLENREKLLAEIRRIASAGKRLLLVALSDPAGQNLSLIGFAVISDPLRGDTKKSVETLRRAGIGVVMVTGDSLDTARAAASGAGILPPSGKGVCLEGKELRSMTPEAIGKLLPRLCVVARAQPGDKALLVQAAREAKLVCGMTGDGVNDAPALKAADVGFSMGSGTELAKEAGDLVILDDSLASIGKAVLYGRTIFKSIRKFIVFQLTMNFIAVGISIIGTFLGVETPVTVMQMLWINLIMDTLGGLAFAGEAPLSSTMEEKPKKKDEGIINRFMIVQIAGVALFSAALLLTFLFSPAARARYGEEKFMTVFFCVFIFLAVLNCFQARTSRLRLGKALFKNRAFCLVILFVVAVQIVIVYRGGRVFSTVPISPRDLWEAFLAALPVIPFGTALKWTEKILKKPHDY